MRGVNTRGGADPGCLMVLVLVGYFFLVVGEIVHGAYCHLGDVPEQECE